MGLTDHELAGLRDTADTFLPGTCTIQTRTESVDALGGGSIAWADTYEGVKCRLGALSVLQDEQVVNYALQGRSAWMLSVKYNQAITIEDRVIFDGDTYEVQSVMDDHSYRTIRRAIVIRVD